MPHITSFIRQSCQIFIYTQDQTSHSITNLNKIFGSRTENVLVLITSRFTKLQNNLLMWMLFIYGISRSSNFKQSKQSFKAILSMVSLWMLTLPPKTQFYFHDHIRIINLTIEMAFSCILIHLRILLFSLHNTRIFGKAMQSYESTTKQFRLKNWTTGCKLRMTFIWHLVNSMHDP